MSRLDGAVSRDDLNPDDPPYALEVGATQERLPRGADMNHMHIWINYGDTTVPASDGPAIGEDDAGGLYQVWACVNCPVVKIRRTA